MIIGKNEEGKAVLLRCGCSHSLKHDYAKYGYAGINIGVNLCQKCFYWGWRITGMTDEELRRREVP